MEKTLGRRGKSHINMCHFSVDEEDLKVLKAAVKNVSRSPFYSYTNYQKFLSSPYRRQFNNYSLKKSAKTTPREYLLDCTSYQSWAVNEHASILHITGTGGLQQEDVAQYLLSKLKEQYAPEETLIACASLDVTDDRRNTADKLCNALLMQILMADPSRFDFMSDVEVGESFLSPGEPDPTSNWRLLRIIFSYNTPKKILCSINILQECPPDKLWFLSHLTALASIAGSRFKVIISTHQNNRLEIPLHISLVESLSMRQHVSSHLTNLVWNKPRLRQFEGEILNQVTALVGARPWQTKLYMGFIEMSMNQTTPRMVRDALASLNHQSLEYVLRNMLSRLSHKDRYWGFKVLSWMLHSFRPLRLQELSTVMSLQATGEPSDEDYSRDFKGDVNRVLKNITNIKGDEVHLLDSQLRELLDSIVKSEKEPDAPIGVNHLTIAKYCLAYLSIERMERVYQSQCHWSISDGSKKHDEQAAWKDGFCVYAAHYWAMHYRSVVNPPSEATLKVLQLLQDEKWLTAWKNISQFEGHSIPEIPVLAHSSGEVMALCIHLGLEDVLKLALTQSEDYESNVDKETKAIFLSIAAKAGHVPIIQFLLRTFDCSPDEIPRALIETPLHERELVIEELTSYLETVHGSSILNEVLEKAALTPNSGLINRIVNLKGGRETPSLQLEKSLCMAIMEGNMHTINTLFDLVMENHSRPVDTKDTSHAGLVSPSSVLHLSVIYGNNEMIHGLSESYISINSKDQKGRTPLHLATIMGYSTIVVQILKLQDVEVNAKDRRERTPLHYVAATGQTEILTMLLEQDTIKFDMKDCERDTPLLLATQNQHIGAVTGLLRKGASATEPNKSGDTALHIAVAKNEIEIARALIESNTNSLNIKGSKSMTPLIRASQYGYLDIFQHLVEYGAELGASDGGK